MPTMSSKSVHTLPAKVQPFVKWNQALAVVLFVSSSQVMLYRLTGTQVWAVPAKRASEAINAEFDDSGEYLVVVYSNGNYQVISVSRGRVLASGEAPPNFSWVGWSNKSLVWGTRAGEISLNLFGVLDTGLFSVGDEAVLAAAEIHSGNRSSLNWVVAFTTKIAFLKAQFSDNDTKIAMLCAEIEKSATEIVALGKRVDAERTTFFQQMSNFFGSLMGDPTSEFYTVLLAGNCSAGMVQWIQARHETGFKRWYKAASQALDTTIETLVSILPLAQRIIAGIGDLIPFAVGSESLQAAEKLLETVVMAVCDLQDLQPQFECFSAWLEVVFVDEIDRAIQVTRKDVGDGYDAVKFIGTGLGLSKFSDELSPICQSFTLSFDHSKSQIRDMLKAQVQVENRITLTSSSRQLITEGNLAHLLTHDKHYVFGSDFTSEESCKEGSVLAGSPLQVVSVSIEAPFAIGRRTETVCILSNDQHHFTFESIEALQEAQAV